MKFKIGKNGRLYPLGKDSPHYKPDLLKHSDEMVSCACGCGELIRKYDVRGDEHRYKAGHHYDWLHAKMRGVPQGIRTPDDKLTCDAERERRAQYYYFNRDGGKDQCLVNNKICDKKLFMVWKDKNRRNFRKENLLRLCHLHKEVFTKRDLTLTELKRVTPAYYKQFKHEQKMAYYYKNYEYYRQKGKERQEKKAEYWLNKGGYVLCSCGCGQSMPKYKANGKERKFLPSHHLRRNWGDTHKSDDGIMKKKATPEYQIEGW